MSPRLPALLALFALVFAAAPASAQKPRYALTVTEHTNKTSPSTSNQTLRKKRTGKIIWVRHFDGGAIITWSKDKKAVAFEVGPTKDERPKHQYDIKLVLWRVGSLVQSFFPQPLIEEDYVEDMFWSPNKKHLLFRTGSSGNADMELGTLWCLNIATHRVMLIDSNVRRVRWANSHRVAYHLVSFAPSHYFDPDSHNMVHYGLTPYERALRAEATALRRSQYGALWVDALRVFQAAYMAAAEGVLRRGRAEDKRAGASPAPTNG